VLPSDCVVLDDYTAAIKTVDLFAIQTEITDIMQFIDYPLDMEADQSTSLIIDSGLDINHCFFYDEVGHVNYYSYTATAVSNIAAGSHSKIKAYIKYAFSDWVDTPNGHGTHTAGILAGFECGLRRGVGINDKLVVMDVGLSSDSSQLYVPTNLIGKTIISIE
jgi:subtilisin family serine protease